LISKAGFALATARELPGKKVDEALAVEVAFLKAFGPAAQKPTGRLATERTTVFSAFHSMSEDNLRRELAVDEARDFEDLIGQAEQLAERMVREETLVAHEQGARTSFRAPTRPTPAGEQRTAGEPQRFRSFGEQLRAVADAAHPGARIDQRLIEQRAATGMSEAVGSDGGFLVQQDFAAEVWRRVYQTGEVIRRCRRIPISTRANSLKIPAVAETSRATGSGPGVGDADRIERHHLAHGRGTPPGQAVADLRASNGSARVSYSMSRNSFQGVGN
jgi:hypothetical protein